MTGTKPGPTRSPASWTNSCGSITIWIAIRNRKSWEILVGDTSALDYLAQQQQSQGPSDPHPLQELIEELVQSKLTEKERTVFYMRFGERASHREIARRMGYRSHRVIQVLEERIINKISEALNAS